MGLPPISVWSLFTGNAASHSTDRTFDSSRNFSQSCLIHLWIHSSSGTLDLKPWRLPSRCHELLRESKISLQCKVILPFLWILRHTDHNHSGGYHGRTFGAMAVTKSKTGYSEGTAPLMVGQGHYASKLVLILK